MFGIDPCGWITILNPIPPSSEVSVSNKPGRNIKWQCRFIVTMVSSDKILSEIRILTNPLVVKKRNFSLLNKVMPRSQWYIGVHQRHLRFKGPIQLNYNVLVFMSFYAISEVSVSIRTRAYPLSSNTSFTAAQSRGLMKKWKKMSGRRHRGLQMFSNLH